MFNELFFAVVLGIVWGTVIGLLYRHRFYHGVIRNVMIGIWVIANLVDYIQDGLTTWEFIVNCCYVTSMWATVELVTTKYRQRSQSLQRQAL